MKISKLNIVIVLLLVWALIALLGISRIEKGKTIEKQKQEKLIKKMKKKINNLEDEVDELNSDKDDLEIRIEDLE